MVEQKQSIWKEPCYVDRIEMVELVAEDPFFYLGVGQFLVVTAILL